MTAGQIAAQPAALAWAEIGVFGLVAVVALVLAPALWEKRRLRLAQAAERERRHAARRAAATARVRRLDDGAMGWGDALDAIGWTRGSRERRS